MAAVTRILLAFAFLGLAFLAGIATRSEHVFIVVFAVGVVASFVMPRLFSRFSAKPS